MNYQQMKQHRIQKQTQKLLNIQSQFDKDEWAINLYHAWPQELPIKVIRDLMIEGHEEVIGEYYQASLYMAKASFSANVIGDLLSDMTRDDADFYFDVSANQFEETEHAEDVMFFLLALPQPVSITITTDHIPLKCKIADMGFSHHELDFDPEDVSFIENFADQLSYTSHFRIDEQWNDKQQHSLYSVLQTAIHTQGGLQIRHTMGLRCQRPNHEGVMQWVNQEKIYGFSLGDGKAIPLNKTQLQQAYCHDQEGNPLPLDSGTHIGDTAAEFKHSKRLHKK